MQALQQQDEIDRSIKLPETINPATFDGTLPGTLASAVGGEAIVVNSSGDGFDITTADLNPLTVIAGNGFLSSNGTTGTPRELTGTANQIGITNGTGIGGAPIFSITNNPVIPGTEGIQIPSGTTAQRPSSPANGDLRYNSTLNRVEVRENGAWIPWRAIQVGTYNIGLDGDTTSVANDSILIQGSDGSALSEDNPGFVTLSSITAGQLTTFLVTANIKIDLTNAHWGLGTFGNVTDYPLSVYAINDGNSIKWGVAALNGLNEILDSDDSATATDINLVDEVLVNTALTSDSPSLEIGWFKANFNDTGDVWTVQTGNRDLNLGPSGPILKPFPMTIDAVGSNPTKGTVVNDSAFWSMSADGLHVQYYYRQSAGGAAGSGVYKFKLPSGLVINTNKAIPDTNNAAGGVGPLIAESTDESIAAGSIMIYDTTSLWGQVVNQTNAYTINNATYDLGQATVTYSFTANRIPIVGWD
jgi:hypothetical protein